MSTRRIYMGFLEDLRVENNDINKKKKKPNADMIKKITETLNKKSPDYHKEIDDDER